MAVNQFGQTYEGNDDFRGWLAAGNGNMSRRDYDSKYLGQNYNYDSGTVSGRSMLDIVGNDGRVNDSVLSPDLAAYAQDLYNQWLNGRTPSANAGIDTNNSNSNYDKQAVDYWNGAIDRYQNQLNGLNGLLDNLNAQTNSDYNTKNNELQNSYDRSKSEYDQSSRQNSQQLQTNKNTIADRASQGLRGLLRTLGAMGAGGSSAALYNAPELVTAQANQERTGANQTFGENQQKLDTNWNNFKLDWENDKKKLEDWKQGQYRQNEQNVLNQRNSILGSMMDAYTQRGAAGQGAGNKINELTNQIKANDNRLTELNQFVKPSYDGTRATYKAPSLSSYNTGASSITTEVSNAPENGFSAKTSPTLAMLLGVKNRKNSNPYGRE